MIQAEDVQEGRMEVVHVDFVLYCDAAEFVGGAVGDARFDATACQPCCKTARVVVTSIAAL